MTSQTPKEQKSTSQQRREMRDKETLLLGDVLGGVMDERIRARHEQAIVLQQAWAEVLPVELAAHCRIEEFSAGILKVAVDGPGYMHELRLCKKELCSEINNILPGATIRDMKMVIGR